MTDDEWTRMATDLIKGSAATLIREAVLAEREACAKVAETMNHNIVATWGLTGMLIEKIENAVAVAIRNRP